VTPVHLGSHLC